MKTMTKKIEPDQATDEELDSQDADEAKTVQPDADTLDTLNAIKDPEERLRTAGAELKKARRGKANARRDRAVGLLVLHRNYKYPKAKLYGRLEILRRHMQIDFNTVTGELPDWSEAEAWDNAIAHNNRWRHWREVESAALLVRSREVRKWLAGEYVDPVPSNAKIGKIAGISAARVTQISTGKTNSARLSEKQQKTLAAMNATGKYSVEDLAEHFGVSEATVHKALNPDALAKVS